MTISAVGLCARALMRIGAAPLASFQDGTAEAELAAGLYPGCRDALLAAHGWSFATRQASLVRLAAPPAGDHAHGFALPDDFLRALSAGTAGRGRGLTFRIQGHHLLCDAPSVLLTYIARLDEAGFPAFFTQALVTRLAAEFCVPMTENTSRADSLMRQAEVEFRRARQIDTSQDSQPGLEDFSLIEARLS
ncbi:hypothetical protein [Niveispirillum irakense]|uniref:hypothetical protein n=1 Tax=Niveispirillum irakense TaxID=34011 RepID=UPI000414D0F8|nr:hypothetical protein [Niveispirillum irakense]